MYRITFLNGPAEGRRLTVRSGSVRIGRGPDCAVRVSDPAMADRHAEIEERDGTIWIRNLDPLHGIEMDGKRSTEAEMRIGGKERLKIGATVLRIEPLHESQQTTSRRVTGLQVWATLAIIALVLGQSLLVVFFTRMYGSPAPEQSLDPAPMDMNSAPLKPAEPAPASTPSEAAEPATP